VSCPEAVDPPHPLSRKPEADFYVKKKEKKFFHILPAWLFLKFLLSTTTSSGILLSGIPEFRKRIRGGVEFFFRRESIVEEEEFQFFFEVTTEKFVLIRKPLTALTVIRKPDEIDLYQANIELLLPPPLLLL